MFMLMCMIMSSGPGSIFFVRYLIVITDLHPHHHYIFPDMIVIQNEIPIMKIREIVEWERNCSRHDTYIILCKSHNKHKTN